MMTKYPKGKAIQNSHYRVMTAGSATVASAGIFVPFPATITRMTLMGIPINNATAAQDFVYCWISGQPLTLAQVLASGVTPGQCFLFLGRQVFFQAAVGSHEVYGFETTSYFGLRVEAAQSLFLQGFNQSATNTMEIHAQVEFVAL